MHRSKKSLTQNKFIPVLIITALIMQHPAGSTTAYATDIDNSAQIIPGDTQQPGVDPNQKPLPEQGQQPKPLDPDFPLFPPAGDGSTGANPSGDNLGDPQNTDNGVPAPNNIISTVSREYEKEPKTSFYAYAEAYRGGVRVAGGDVDGDGFDEIITGAGVDRGINAGQGSGSHVAIFKVDETGKETLTRSFFAFDPGFTGGVNVEAGDVNGDGAKDIIVAAGLGGNAHVKVFDGRTNEVIRSFFAYENFQGEVRIASADVNGDGISDIITGAGPGGGPHVKVFNGLTGEEIKSFFALEQEFTGGIFVAAGDMNGDGRAEIVVTTDAALGRPPMVYVFDGNTDTQIASFKAFDANHNGDFYGGVRVSVKDVNSDGLGDVIVSSGPGPDTSGHVRFFETTPGSDGGLSFKGTVSFFPYNSFAGGVRATFGYFKAGFGILTGAGGGKYDSPLGPDNIAGPHVKIFYQDTSTTLVTVTSRISPAVPLNAEPEEENGQRAITLEVITADGVTLTHFRLNDKDFLEIKTRAGKNLKYKVPPGNRFKVYQNPAGNQTIITHDGIGFPQNSILALNNTTGQLFQVNLPGVQNSTTNNVAGVGYPSGTTFNLTLNNPNQNLLFDLLI